MNFYYQIMGLIPIILLLREKIILFIRMNTIDFQRSLKIVFNMAGFPRLWPCGALGLDVFVVHGANDLLDRLASVFQVSFQD